MFLQVLPGQRYGAAVEGLELAVQHLGDDPDPIMPSPLQEGITRWR